MLDSVLWTIVGAAITLVVAILNWATSSQEATKWDKRLYHYVLLGAAFVTAYGSWRAFLINEETTWQQADVKFRSEWLQQNQLKERLRYEKELRTKADEITALSRTIAGSVTGGDSFCYITVLSNSSRELLRLIVSSRGKFPLYDVTARIADLDERFPNSLEVFFTQPTLILGTLVPGSAALDPKWVIKNTSGSTLKKYNIFFNARNGFFDQSLRIA